MQSGSGERLPAEAALVVSHAMKADDPQALFDVLRTDGYALLTPSGHEVLAPALDALPREVRSSDPSVLVIEAMLSRLDCRYDEASELSSAADQLVAVQRSASGAEPDALTQDCLALMRLWRSRCGWTDPHLAVQEARELLGCRHQESDTHELAPGHSLMWSTWLMGELATVEIRIGELSSAGLHLRDLIQNGRALGDERMIATGLAHRSLLELIDGAFQTGAATARVSLGYEPEDDERIRPYMAQAHLVAGWAALHELDLHGCQEHLTKAEQQAAIDVDVLVVDMARLLRVRLLAEQGMLGEARRLLAQHRSEYEFVPAFLRRLRVVLEAQITGVANDVAALRDRVLTLDELGCPDDAALFAALADATDGDVDDALAELGALLDRPRLDSTTSAAAAALRVGLSLRQGETDEAAKHLPDLLTRVAPQRLLQVLSIGFLGGVGFVELLADEARQADGHPFAAEALAGLVSYVVSSGQDTPRARPVAEALRGLDTTGLGATKGLTRRERDVLVELSLGGSYSDVAHALFVSENTVKTHLASVYRKLGVERRGDALRVARELRLL